MVEKWARILSFADGKGAMMEILSKVLDTSAQHCQ